MGEITNHTHGGQASPNPTYPQTINSVTGNQDVVVSGKNLFDKNAVPVITNNLPITILDTGVRIGNIQNNTSYVFCNYKIMDLTNYVGKTIRAKANFTPSGNNTAKYYIGLCDVNGNNRVQKANGNVSGETISYEVTEISGDSKYLCIVLYANNGGNALKDDYVDFTDLIITIDDEDMSYEPYITPTSYQLSLGDIQLNAIGNYKDELIYDVDEDKVYKKEKIGETIFNNVSNLYQETIFGVNKKYFFQTISTAKSLGNPAYNFYCEILSKSNGVANDYSGFFNGTNIVVLLNDSDTKETATEKYSGKSLLYVRNTPTLTEITDETLHAQVKALYNAHSNNGTTIITSNGDLPMIIKVRGLKGE